MYPDITTNNIMQKSKRKVFFTKGGKYDGSGAIMTSGNPFTKRTRGLKAKLAI